MFEEYMYLYTFYCLCFLEEKDGYVVGKVKEDIDPDLEVRWYISILENRDKRSKDIIEDNTKYKGAFNAMMWDFYANYKAELLKK